MALKEVRMDMFSRMVLRRISLKELTTALKSSFCIASTCLRLKLNNCLTRFLALIADSRMAEARL